MPLLFDGHWYTSKLAVGWLTSQHVIGEPHLTPDGQAVLVFDRGDNAPVKMPVIDEIAKFFGIPDPPPSPPCLVPQATDGCTFKGKPLRDLMITFDGRTKRIEIDPALLPDLERLVEFDHLPEARKVGALEVGLHKPGDKLA